MAIYIDAPADGGNIQVRSIEGDVAKLDIATDAGGEHKQWFYFRASGVQGRTVSYRIENAGTVSYPKGFHDYRAVVSTDRETWTRAPTTFDGKVMHITHHSDANVVWVAYFAPYPMNRHDDLVARMQSHATLERLGASLDGAPIDCLVMGNETGPVVWVLARQHPGETMAEWALEGLLERLTDGADPVSRWLLAHARFYIVPNANPDGSRRGHLRTNACGANLNREWQNPTAERSPEVLAMRNRMDETGVRICLDVHGDEAIPYNFGSGAEGIPGWTNQMTRDQATFEQAVCKASPDYQVGHGYPKSKPGEANLTMCTNQVADRFGAFSITIEQPFKDHDYLPDPVHGWSPARSKHLGGALLDGVRAVLDPS